MRRGQNHGGWVVGVASRQKTPASSPCYTKRRQCITKTITSCGTMHSGAPASSFSMDCHMDWWSCAFGCCENTGGWTKRRPATPQQRATINHRNATTSRYPGFRWSVMTKATGDLVSLSLPLSKWRRVSRSRPAVDRTFQPYKLFKLLLPRPCKRFSLHHLVTSRCKCVLIKPSASHI